MRATMGGATPPEPAWPKKWSRNGSGKELGCSLTVPMSVRDFLDRFYDFYGITIPIVYSQSSAVVQRARRRQPKVISKQFMHLSCMSVGP